MKEVELVILCQRGKPQGQKALFDAYADRFFRLALRYVKTQAEAEDLVMSSFLKIFSHIGSFTYESTGSLEAWMRKIVINECLMWIRKHHNPGLTETLDLDNPDHETGALPDVDAEYLYQLIVELPPGYRTVFNLYVIEGYDHGEICKLLQISESTSRSQLFKAKEILRRKLKQAGLQYGT